MKRLLQLQTKLKKVILFCFILFIKKTRLTQYKYMLKDDYLLNLNEKQQEAVLHLEGPLLIVAGWVW